MQTTKRLMAVLLAMLMLVGILTPMASANNIHSLSSWHTFTDAGQNLWHTNAVQFVFQNGIMTGTSATQFNPYGNLTRAESTALIFRLHMDRDANANDSIQNDFQDVSNTAWYAPYVTWAANNGIVTGVDERTFHPTDRIIREDFATMLYRYAMQMTNLSDTYRHSAQWLQFVDRGNISSWAYYALRWMNYHGIITGQPSAMISPGGTAIRVEAATIMMRFMRVLGVGNHVLPEPPPPPPHPTRPFHTNRTRIPGRTWTQECINALARNGWGEARGVTWDEMLMVHHTVFNRVMVNWSGANAYRDSIQGVIRQPGQFHGYRSSHPLEPWIVDSAVYALYRWAYAYPGPVNRFAQDGNPYYLYFRGDGRHNWFRSGRFSYRLSGQIIWSLAVDCNDCYDSVWERDYTPWWLAYYEAGVDLNTIEIPPPTSMPAFVN